MSEQEFIKKCKELVAKYTEDHIEKGPFGLTKVVEPYVVWSCKTLQNNKALLSTPVEDGMYYELTYNGDKGELYFDAYKKWENRCIEIKEADHD